MSPFDPENTARALMPRDLLSRAAALHLAMHIQPMQVEVAVFSEESFPASWSEKFVVTTSQEESYQVVNDFLKARNWHQSVFKKVSISFDTAEFTLLPQAFEMEGELGELLAFNLQQENIDADSTVIEKLGANVVFNKPGIIDTLRSLWPNAIILPHMALMLRYAGQHDRGEKSIFVSAISNALHLVAMENGKLMIANRYHMQGPDDVLYHTANACIRLGYDLPKTPLHVLGDKHTLLLEALRNYSEAIVENDDANDFYPLSAHLLCV